MSDTKKRRPNSFRASRNSAPLNSRPTTTMSLSAPNVSNSRNAADVSTVGAATRSKTIANLATAKVSLQFAIGRTRIKVKCESAKLTSCKVRGQDYRIGTTPVLTSALLNYGTFSRKNFRSRERKYHGMELLLPGAKVQELSLQGTFAPWNFRSRERKFQELLLPRQVTFGRNIRSWICTHVGAIGLYGVA